LNNVQEASSPGTEPAYLRNDAIAGFAYTANFGSPYDSILAAALNTTQSAIAPGFTTTPAAGQTSHSEKFQLIANSSDLYSALNISASLSVSSGLASVNAKTSFAQSTQIDSTDLWVLADLSQIGTAEKIVNPTLTAQAAALSPNDFYALYGDRYAAEIVTGAEMFCALQIQTYSQEDKSALAASLGFSYGASSVSASFSSSVTSKTSNRSVKVNCEYLGFTPSTLVTDLPSLLNAATDFQSGGDAGALGNVTTSTLYLLYTSYYGIPGYPGVPAGTAPKVAQQAQLAADFLLYNSLVNNDFSAYYGDSSYASLPFFAHMKSYRDALSAYLSASITDSQNPGVAVPASSADGVITDWKTTSTVSSGSGATPQFTAHGLSNGIVPKRISDYSIPLRYAYPDQSGNGTLNGTTFSPVSPVPAVVNLAAQLPVDYQLYLINKPGAGGGLWLEYQWDTGTYYFTNVTNAQGAPDPTLIGSAITSFDVKGDRKQQYVLVNKANGLVMTDTGTSTPMVATHFATGNNSQLWGFYLDKGNTCSDYVPPAASGGTPGMNCTTGGNTWAGTTACGTLLYGISAAAFSVQRQGYWNVGSAGAANVGTGIYANGGAGCDYCDYGCASFNCPYSYCSGGPYPTGNFFLVPYDKGNTQGIYNYAGSFGGVVTYVVTDLTATSATSSLEKVVNGGSSISGNANELWVFVPLANVDVAP
jgi:hypothetical protein